MDFSLTPSDVPSRTTGQVRERLATGRGCVVVGRPGTGKTHAVREAVRGALWIDLSAEERQFDYFFADLAAQLANGQRIVDALRARDTGSVLKEADAALGNAVLVVDGCERLHLDETWGWDDPVEALWRPDQARLAGWIALRLASHPLVVIARGRRDFLSQSERIPHTSPPRWPLMLESSERGFRDWPALARALRGLPAGLWAGALLLELMRADEFNSLVRSLADDVEQGEEDGLSPQDVLRELLRVLKERMPDHWRRVLATVEALDGAPAAVVERVLHPEDAATLRHLENLRAVARRGDRLSVLPALHLDGPIAKLFPSERREILAAAAKELLERVPQVERPDAHSAQWIVRAHALYVEIGDIDAAYRTARFHLGGLVRLARARSFAGSHSEARRIYGLIEPLAAGEPRTMSYVVHYQHMNGHWAREISPGTVLDGLRRARALWPENALWWQRETELLLELGRGVDALRTVESAYAHVPDHPRRNLLLRVRPASHAVRDTVGAYVDALRLLQPLDKAALESDPEAREQVDAIFDRWRHGVRLQELGTSPEGHLVFHQPVLVSLERLDDDDFRAESRVLERAARGRAALDTLDKLAQVVADELRRLVQTPSTRLDAEDLRHKGVLIGLIDLLNSDIGLTHRTERWILGRFEGGRFVPILGTLPPVDLDPGSLPPAGPDTLYFGKFPVSRDGRPSGPPDAWELAGSGRSLEELWKQLQEIGGGSDG